MFSLLCHRIAKKDAQPAKRSAEEGGETEVTEEPKAKVQKLELFQEENDVELQVDLANKINSYIRRHVADKVIKEKILDFNPIPSNIDKPQKLDMFMKDSLSSHKAFNIARDSQLFNIQSSIHKIFGPLSSLWEVAEEDHKGLLQDENIPDEVRDKMEEMCTLFSHVVALVGQASNKVAYYRRLNMVETLTGDSKRAKELLSENEEVFIEKSSNLFGERFEELVVKLAKSKKKSKDALSNLASPKPVPPAANVPFRKSSLSKTDQGGDRGRNRGSFSGWMSRSRSSFNKRGKPSSFNSLGNSVCGTISKCPPISKGAVSKGNPSNNSSRKDKILPGKLEKTDKGSDLIGDGERVQNPLSRISFSSLESKLLRLSSEPGHEGTNPRGGEQHDTERGNCSRVTITRPLCKPSIFSTKKGPGAETSDKPEKIERAYSIRTLQDGRVISSKGNSGAGGLDVENRPQRCVLRHTFRSAFSKVCEVRVGREPVPIPMPLLRTIPSSESIFKNFEGSDLASKEIRGSFNYFPRRYTVSGLNSRGVEESEGHNHLSFTKSWVFNKCEEVGFRSNSKNRILGDDNRLNRDDTKSAGGKGDSHKETVLGNVREGESSSKRVIETSGKIVCLGAGNFASTSSVQESSTSTDFRVERTGLIQSISGIEGRGESGNKVVALQSRPLQWEKSDNTPSTDNNPDRCLQKGLGSCVSECENRGPMVSGGTTGAHKCLGTRSRQNRSNVLCSKVPGNIGSCPDGQYSSFEVSPEDGGHQECGNESNKQKDMGFFNGRQDHPYCRIPARDTEHRSRQGIQTEGFQRMEIKTMPIQATLSSERHSRHRSICFQGVKPGSSLLFLENGPLQSGAGCLSTGLEECQRLCISPLLSNRKSIEENNIRPSQSGSNNTSLAGAALVSNSPSTVGHESNPSPNGERSSETPRQRSSSCLKQIPKADCMDVVRKQLASKGISEKATTLIIDSRRSGTRSHYKSAWGKWASWCGERQVDPVGCPVRHILDFLTELFMKGLQHSTIGGYRSAISAYHDSCDGSSVGEHPLVKRLMIGIFNKRPPQPRYGFTWDVETVLRYINDLDSSKIDIKLLSLKLTVLLALTGASRASELNMLDTEFLSRYSSKYTFELEGITKTQKPGDRPTKMDLFKFQENLSLCVCHTIDEFLSRTKERRGAETRLLISYNKPFKRVSTDTISRWLKEVIGLAGIDTKIFKGHSTRSAVTSKASRLGISMKDILERANWTNESTFQRFYNKKIGPGKGEIFQKSIVGSFEQG